MFAQFKKKSVEWFLIHVSISDWQFVSLIVFFESTIEQCL